MIKLQHLLISLALGGVLLSGCSAAQPTVRDDDGNITEANEHASVFEMEVGDCYLESGPITEESSEFETLPAVPCSEEHDFEVYANSTLEGQTLLDEDELFDTTIAFCEKRFKKFVGNSYDDSTLDIIYFYPTPESWSQGDRAITCLVSDSEGPSTGSLKKSRR